MLNLSMRSRLDYRSGVSHEPRFPRGGNAGMNWITGPPEPLTLLVYVLIMELAGLLSLILRLLWAALFPAAEAIGRRLARKIGGQNEAPS